MVKDWIISALFFLIIILSLLILCSQRASANHNVYLPLVPNTPLMQQVIRQQEYAWCADARASAYPNFLSQLRDVNDQYAARVGIRHREVAFSDPACQVRHVMPDGLSCSGWAARIYYANWPVTVEYCWTLGYQDWRSAQGHEEGHGLLGLHEMYRDSGGTIGCTGRQDTVMDCGGNPQVRYPTLLDVGRGCAIILTLWCGQTPLPPECGSPCWDGTDWVFSDGWRFRPNPGAGEWRDPNGVLVWAAVDPSWNGRYSPVLGAWVQRGNAGSAFVDGYGWLSLVVP